MRHLCDNEEVYNRLSGNFLLWFFDADNNYDKNMRDDNDCGDGDDEVRLLLTFGKRVQLTNPLEVAPQAIIGDLPERRPARPIHSAFSLKTIS